MMSRLAIPFALTAVALVAACAHRAEPAPTPVVVVPQQQPTTVVAAPPPVANVVVQPTALRPGFGRVETIAAVPTTSGAGSSAPGAMRRLGIKMEDGTMQYVDSDSPNAIGERVQLTGDGYIRPAP
jgi:hypothetical protein